MTLIINFFINFNPSHGKECPPFLGTSANTEDCQWQSESSKHPDRRVEAWGTPMSAESSAGATHCRTRMAKATVGAAGIEYIQGAMLKPKKANGHKHGNYLIMTHRTAPTANPDCQRIYSKPADAYTRTTEPGADELARRERFAAVSRAAQARKRNLSTIAADKAAFEAQKDSGYSTLYKYLWHVCADAYDQQNG